MTDPAARLADTLRGLLDDLHRTDVDPAAASALTDVLDQSRASIVGSPRPRWYEQPDGVDDAARLQQWRNWSLFRGEHQPLAAPMRTERDRDADGELVRGRVVCGRMYEGPPGAVHGGYIAGLFDDILGACLSLVDGPSGVTGRLTVRYRRPTPLETPLVFEARPTEVRARRMRAEAVLLVDGVRTAEAEALFVRRPLDGHRSA